MRQDLVDAVQKAVGARDVVWFGTRGEDVESLTDLPALTASFSLIGAYRRRSSVQGGALEDLTGVRPDLDTFDLDDHLRDEAVAELRQGLLRALARPTALVTYRPSAFLSAVAFARSDHCRYLGMFSGHQAAFEHKPWVESGLAGLGIPHISWRYIADADRVEVPSLLRAGPLMLRRSRTTGGVGLWRLDDAEDLEAFWPDEAEAFVSVAPFVTDAVPVNISAVVWPSDVTLHPLSVQLIGLRGATNRPFGYCGNDFAAARDLPRDVVDSIEATTVLVGKWLRSHGFVGAYGVDFLVKDGVALFTEVNPRFQGSTHLAGQLMLDLELPCVLLDHVAACLGLEPEGPRPSLWDLTHEVDQTAHLVVHSVAEAARTFDVASLVADVADSHVLSRADVVAEPSLTVEPGGTLVRLVTRSRLTTTGFDLHEPLRTALDAHVDTYLAE